MKKKKKQKRNKKVSTLFIVVLSLVCITAFMIKFVYAAMTSNDDVANKFMLADGGGNIVEKFNPPNDLHPMKPGDTYPKVVQISNKEETPFFVRLLIIPEIQSTDNISLPSEIGKEVSFTINDKWLLGEDGYYYYLDKVVPDTATTALFTEVKLANNLGEEYENSSLKIHVKSETVIANTNSYKKAWWPNGISADYTNLTLIDATLSNSL